MIEFFSVDFKSLAQIIYHKIFDYFLNHLLI